MGIDFSKVTIPFTAGDTLSGGTALMGVVAGFVILGLAFLVAPKIIKLIVTAFKSAS